MTDEVKLEVVQLTKVEQVYDKGCDVLLEQLGALKGAQVAALQPVLQIIDVAGRLVHSLYPIIAAIQSEREDTDNADNQKDTPEV